MLAEHKLKALQDLISGASKEELAWINNYISSQLSPATAQAAGIQKFVANKVTIAYGTETGNSKRVATDFVAKAKKLGIHAKVVSLDQYRLTDLAKEEYFLTVISTQGEGEPPASAKKFYDHIHQNGFQLPKLKYGVLALGDTSYPMFCQAGEDVDLQLGSLGGSRIVGIQRCDVDFESDAHHWMNEVIQKISGGQTASDSAVKPVKKSTGKK